jgi:site-specific recombinase XerD
VSPFAAQPVTNPQLARVIPPTGDAGRIISIVDGAVAAHIRWMRLRGLSTNTVKLRRTALGLLAVYVARPLLEATPDEIDAWQSTLGFLAVQTRASYVSHVRNFYRWAVEYGHLTENPATVLASPRVPKRLPRPISEARMASAMAMAPQPIRLWFELAAYGSARAGEIAVLERPDILADEREPMIVLHGKGGKERMVPLAPALAESLDQPCLPRQGRLFRRASGLPMTPRDVSRQANDWLHDHGYPETIHQFRHRFGTQALRAGANLRQVQELMGHESPATTAIYTLVNPTDAAPAVAAIDHPLLRPVQDTGS